MASWECWGTGSIPSLVQWVKDLALPQLWLRSQLWLGSDPWPRNSICHKVAKKRRKKIDNASCGMEVGVRSRNIILVKRVKGMAVWT